MLVSLKQEYILIKITAHVLRFWDKQSAARIKLEELNVTPGKDWKNKFIKSPDEASKFNYVHC